MTASPRALPAARAGQAGFSLVELMVSLVVGMLVVGSLFAGYYAITVSNRHTQAMIQITEDASMALNMLRQQVSLANYSRPVGASGTKYALAYEGAGLAGCDSGFNDLSVAIAELDCKDIGADDSLHDSIAVAYEADAANSMTSGAVPLDCLGNALAQTGAGAGAYYLGYSRFYLSDSKVSSRTSLYCRGPGNAAGQALVENIEDLQIRYGVSNDLNAAPARVGYYTSASDLAAASKDNIATKMGNVIAVRICVLAASADAVMEKDPATDTWPTYRNCSGADTAPGDGRMYRAFTSTVLLHNRLGAV